MFFRMLALAALAAPGLLAAFGRISDLVGVRLLTCHGKSAVMSGVALFGFLAFLLRGWSRLTLP